MMISERENGGAATTELFLYEIDAVPNTGISREKRRDSGEQKRFDPAKRFV